MKLLERTEYMACFGSGNQFMKNTSNNRTIIKNAADNCRLYNELTEICHHSHSDNLNNKPTINSTSIIQLRSICSVIVSIFLYYLIILYQFLTAISLLQYHNI